MIHDLRPYPAMKDSGVPWLGQVPEHWDVQPALAVYKPREVKNTGLIEKTVLSLSYGRIIVKPEEKLRGLVPESFETYQIVETGNIIVRTTDLQNDRNSLRIGHSKNRGIITSAYMCLETTDRVLNEFGYQYLNAYDLLKIIYGYGSGLRQSLDFKDIRRMPVLVPPPDEQAAIVRFLHYADRRIRKAIAAKQRLIKLLQEQKQVIIHQAVTRGLDPNVKLKPSGVEWLGDVPEGWDVRPFHTVFTDKQIKNLGLIETKVLSLSYGRIIAKAEDKLRGLVPESFETYQVVDPDTIIIRPTDLQNDQKSLRVGISEQRGIITSAYMALISKSISALYAFWLLAAFDYKKIFYNLGAGTRQSLKFIDLKRLPILVPASDEQKAIVLYIETESAKLDQALTRAQAEITLLREYRTRLIADVVTGKLDVREAALFLPELTAEAVSDELEGDGEGELEADEVEAEVVEA